MQNIDRTNIQLIGTWVSEPTDNEWGTVIHEYTFQNDFSVLCVMRPYDPDGLEEDVTPIKARYKMNDKSSFVVLIGKPGDTLKGEIKKNRIFIRNETDSKYLVFKKREP